MTKAEADVLVIDDSELARASIVRAFSEAGVSVVDLPSPIGATSVILRRGIKVVVIDINMPAMPGDRLAALFRKNRRFSELRVVLISGTEAHRLARLALEVQADAVLAKSEGPGRLVDIVRKLLAEI